MAMFNNMTLTTKGQLLYVKAQAGQEIKFTKMMVGSGDIDSRNPSTLLSLIEPKFDVGIQSITPNTEQKIAVISGKIDNSSVTEATYICEIGLFAKDPDDGEVLYAYGTAGKYGDYYAPATSGPFSWSYDIEAAIGNAANVTVELSNLTFDYGVKNTNTTFIVISGGNQKEINKSIDKKLLELAEQSKDIAKYCYSLKDAITIESSTNLNTLTAFGNYVCVGAGIGATLINSPVSSAFVMKVERIVGDTNGAIYNMQTIKVATSTGTKTYVRCNYNGTYTEWEQIGKDSDIKNIDGRNAVATDANNLGIVGQKTIDRTDGNTLNTPYKAGLTGSYASGEIETYFSSTSYGIQIGYSTGKNVIFTRELNNGVWGSWKQLATTERPQEIIITPQNGFTIPKGSSAYYIKSQDDIVTLNVFLNNSATVGLDITIFNLPTNYRPTQLIRSWGIARISDTRIEIAEIYINSSGDVSVHCIGSNEFIYKNIQLAVSYLSTK